MAFLKKTMVPWRGFQIRRGLLKLFFKKIHRLRLLKCKDKGLDLIVKMTVSMEYKIFKKR